jgi:hypothetical protein
LEEARDQAEDRADGEVAAACAGAFHCGEHGFGLVVGVGFRVEEEFEFLFVGLVPDKKYYSEQSCNV